MSIEQHCFKQHSIIRLHQVHYVFVLNQIMVNIISVLSSVQNNNILSTKLW